MTLKQALNLQIALAFAEVYMQLFGLDERRAYAWAGLKDRWYHIKAERAVMKANLKRFWYPIIARDKMCLRCGSTKELQVDHVVSLFLFGKTEWNNLQTLCGRCNRKKGKLDCTDYRPKWAR